MAKRKLKPLPKFRNEDEEREFWTSHEIVDFIDTSRPINLNLSNLDQVYEAFDKMECLADSNKTNTSTTIDEVLYGEKGAWRGSES